MIINDHLVNTHFLDTFLWFQFNVIFARNILTNYTFCIFALVKCVVAKLRKNMQHIYHRQHE